MRPPPCDAESAPLAQAFRRLVMRIGVEADDRAAVPGRIFLRVLHHPASIPVAREPRRHAQRMHDKHILAFAGILPCHVVVFRGLGISISCWHGSHHPLPARSSPLRARRASVQRSSGIRPIPNGNRLHAPARKSADLVGRGDRRDIRRCCLSYHAISSFSNPGEP